MGFNLLKNIDYVDKKGVEYCLETLFLMRKRLLLERGMTNNNNNNKNIEIIAVFYRKNLNKMRYYMKI